MALELIEPLYRLKVRRISVRRVALALVDTSGSMFEHVFGISARQLRPETAAEYAERALDMALSAALQILLRLLESGAELAGYIGFFSAKDRDFIYGGPFSGALLGGQQRGDYYSLEGLDEGTVAHALEKKALKISATTGGTDPNPLLKFLAELALKEHGRIDGIYVVTDGYVLDDTVAIPVDAPAVLVIMPHGTVPRVVHPNPSRVRVIRLGLAAG